MVSIDKRKVKKPKQTHFCLYQLPVASVSQGRNNKTWSIAKVFKTIQNVCGNHWHHNMFLYPVVTKLTDPVEILLWRYLQITQLLNHISSWSCLKSYKLLSWDFIILQLCLSTFRSLTGSCYDLYMWLLSVTSDNNMTLFIISQF